MEKEPRNTLSQLSKEELMLLINFFRGAYLNKVGKDIKRDAFFEENFHLTKLTESEFIRIFGMSKSSFYYKKQKLNEGKLFKIHDNLDKLVIDCWRASNNNYGINRIYRELNMTVDASISYKMVRNSMKRLGIKSLLKPNHKRDDPKTKDKSLTNKVNGNFIVNAPYTLFSTDTSYILSPHGYKGHFIICALLDVFNYGIHGFEISKHNDQKLIIQSYKSISKNIVKNGIIHSDRGSAHLANETKKVVKEMNGVISVGQRGKSSDNYPIELFWAVIKYECLNKIPYLERTIERIKNEVAIFLDWYHNKRRQSNLNYLTPSDKLKKYFGL